MTPNLSGVGGGGGARDTDEALLEKAGNLRASLELDAILVTRSEAGMTLIERDGPAQHLTASAQEVFDVTGAGDTVIAVMAGGLSAGLSWLTRLDTPTTPRGSLWRSWVLPA